MNLIVKTYVSNRHGVRPVRRLWIVAALTLLWCLPSYAQIANVQKGKVGSWSSGASWTTTITSTSAHDLITISCVIDTARSVSSITDNGSGGSSTYSDTSNNITATGSLWKAVMWYAKDSKASITTITTTLDSTPTFGECFVEEWSGTDLTSPLDQKNAATGNSTTTQPNSGNITPTATNELILGYVIPNTGNFTKGTSFTVATSPVTADTTQYVIQTSIVTLASSGTMSANDVWTSSVVSFKQASGGGGAIPTRHRSRIL